MPPQERLDLFDGQKLARQYGSSRQGRLHHQITKLLISKGLRNFQLDIGVSEAGKNFALVKFFRTRADYRNPNDTISVPAQLITIPSVEYGEFGVEASVPEEFIALCVMMQP